MFPDDFDEILAEMRRMFNSRFFSRFFQDYPGEPIHFGYKIIKESGKDPYIEIHGNLDEIPDFIPGIGPFEGFIPGEIPGDVFQQPEGELSTAPHAPAGLDKEVVEPFYETFTRDNGTYEVVVDLPGVAEEDVTVGMDGRVLIIEASNNHRAYSLKLPIPDGYKVPENGLSWQWNNGMVLVRLQARNIKHLTD